MGLLVAAAGIVGLLVGSFLNVVIHRLPMMMERQWAAQCAEFGGTAAADAAQPEPFNLAVPRSRCPHCGHRIAWYENIPVLSFLLLRGKCAGCRTAIGWRYPLVELATGVLFAWAIWRFGVTPAAGLWCLFSAILIALTLIDWDTTLLPDDLTLPLLWAGLLGAALGWTGTALGDAVWGAAAGYLVLWLIYWAFKLATGKEGMGYGDFKLLAALGAWFGWQALVPIALMASGLGAVIGIGMKLAGKTREGGVIPFGPFLALAGLTAMLFGAPAILRAVGLQP
ncbi:MAG: prepilin peptidase [Ottowia sp.]